MIFGNTDPHTLYDLYAVLPADKSKDNGCNTIITTIYFICIGYAYARNNSDSKWYCFDDANVSEIESNPKVFCVSNFYGDLDL